MFVVGLIALLATIVAAGYVERRLMPKLSPPELLRWGFLLMLPAAIVGSVAAWPSFRTLSAFRTLYILLSVGAFAWLLLNRRLPSNVRVRWFLAFLALWVAWSLVSLTWAADKAAGLKYLVFLVMMASLTAGTVLAIDNQRTLRVGLVMLLLAFAAAIAIGLVESATDFRLPTSALVDAVERAQWAVTSLFHNQNDFATYIALWLPFLLAAPFFTERRSLVALSGTGAVLTAICFLYTGSRTNLLAIALVAPSLLSIVLGARSRDIDRRRLAVGILILVGVTLVIFLGISGSVRTLPEIGVQHWRFDTLGGEMAAGTGSGGSRIKLIQGGLIALLDSHLLGVGPGNAEYHLRLMPGTELVYNLHNWWMEVLVNGGVFIFVGYVLFYTLLLYHLLGVARTTRDRTLAYVSTSLFAALVGYVFGSLSPSSAIHFTPMWIHFGLALAVINLHRKQRADA